VRKGDKGRGGDRKRRMGENEIFALPVCPSFFGGSIVSRLNVVPEKEKEVLV
jgi:hypothetical protein